MCLSAVLGGRLGLDGQHLALDVAHVREEPFPLVSVFEHRSQHRQDACVVQPNRAMEPNAPLCGAVFAVELEQLPVVGPNFGECAFEVAELQPEGCELSFIVRRLV
ncbi:MAG: hypothetical protein RIS45_893 [Planctomycetota bacterium]